MTYCINIPNAQFLCSIISGSYCINIIQWIFFVVTAAVALVQLHTFFCFIVVFCKNCTFQTRLQYYWPVRDVSIHTLAGDPLSPSGGQVGSSQKAYILYCTLGTQQHGKMQEEEGAWRRKWESTVRWCASTIHYKPSGKVIAFYSRYELYKSEIVH